MSDVKFYKEKNTNNIITLINGEFKNDNYILLDANTTDCAVEKHVPVYEIVDDKIKVSVGSIVYPMESSHYIMWIALASGKKVTIKKFNPDDIPETTFEYVKGSIIYAYCNLHGLWKSSVE